MRVTQHLSNNAVLRAPDGHTIEQCRAAPITRTLYADGTETVATYWQPTDAERAAIAAGASVRVEVMGQTMPPMLVGADGVEPV
jgi:hypothetical protein